MNDIDKTDLKYLRGDIEELIPIIYQNIEMERRKYKQNKILYKTTIYLLITTILNLITIIIGIIK